MRDSLTNPVHVYEGDDALITCVVKNIGDNSVMWKKEHKDRASGRVLTAGTTRVTSDKRFSVLHDSGNYFFAFPLLCIYVVYMYFYV